MKVNYFTTGLFLLFIMVAACNRKTEGSSNDSNEWPEMDSFHMIMAEAYHPFKDSANLEPAKRLAEEMALEAVRWESSTLPEKVNSDETRDQLKKLKDQTRTLADGMKGGATDEESGKLLTELHETFHGIMEAWYQDKKKHDH